MDERWILLSRRVWNRLKQIRSVPILFDYVLVGIALALLVPAFRVARLPLKVDVLQIACAYWLGTAGMAVSLAIIAAALCLPYKQVLGPALQRFREKPDRIGVVLLIFLLLVDLKGLGFALVVMAAALGIAEALERRRSGARINAYAVLLPAFFLFLGLVAVFSLNHAIAGIRNPQMYDRTLHQLDWALFRVDVSVLAHWSSSHLPVWCLRTLEGIYFGLYAGLGAALLLTAMLKGAHYAMKFVRAILICYAIAVIVYLVVPAKGPYSICPLHAEQQQHSAPTFWTQETLASRVQLLWEHKIGPDEEQVNLEDYFISFPSLHVALPIIVFWFIQPWKRLARSYLAVYIGFFLPAVLLLEWHYLVDFAGGFIVAILSILLCERLEQRPETADSAVPVAQEAPAFPMV